MPRKKKHPTEWTTEEAMRKLFPKPVRDALKDAAHKDAKPQVNRPKESK
jgi:hypothetical protein